MQFVDGGGTGGCDVLQSPINPGRSIGHIQPVSQELEDESTRLLKAHGAAYDDVDPAYGEAYKLGAQNRRNGVIHLEDIPEDIVDRTMMGAVAHISKRTIIECARRKRCTLRQIEILEYKCYAFYNVEIADLMGVDERTVRRDLYAAVRLMSDDPYFPLIEVLCEVFHLRHDTIKAILMDI